MTYLILQHPGHNRVYYNSADKLALAELNLACKRLSVVAESMEIQEIAAIRYLSFKTQEKLTQKDIQIVSSLSFVFALFCLEDSKQNPVLIPIRKFRYEYLDNKLSTVLKYQGKTNELFTKMMVNVALLASNFSYSDPIRLLDPVAGKGTTLFESAIYGFNSFGVEIDNKSTHESVVFFRKFLQEERLKYSLAKRQIAGSKKSNATFIDEFRFAKSKGDFKLDETSKKLGVVTGDSVQTDKFFKKDFFHLIVGDLPYGIQHGNKGKRENQSITRNPAELLDSCLAAWFKVLKKGGTVVLAWNSFVASKQKLSSLFVKHGFDVQTDPLFESFEHMVDKSIKRDIIVARKS